MLMGDDKKTISLTAMAHWFQTVRNIHQKKAWQGVHDEGTFVTSWREYYLHTKDLELQNFAYNLLEKVDKWRSNHLTDG